MSKLQNLSVFLTDRLTLAAQEIFKAVEDVFLEYNDEICRSKVEIELLKKRLLQAGIEIEPQAGSSENPDQNYTQMLPGEWTSEPSENETEIHTKIEVYTHDGNVQMPGCEDLASSHASRDDICTQGYKNLESLTPENSWNSSFINHTVHIKNEPESDIETSTTGQMQLFTSHDSRSREQFGDINEIKINHTGFTRLPFMNEELLMQQAAHLAPISESSSNIEPKKSSARARSQKHRLKVSRNPELLEMYRRRERESKLQSVRERMRKRKGQNEEMLREKKTRQTEAFQQANQADGTEGFPCVVCHRKFNTPALRKVHLRVHSGEKPYHCRFCGKNFRQSSHLKTHVRIHTGERPHTCKTCGKTFVDSSGRNRHVRKCSLQRT